MTNAVLTDKVFKKVVDLLTNKPELFSAKWFSGKSIDNSIKTKGTTIHILNTGHIFIPPTEMNDKQLKEVKVLVDKIVERDTESLLTEFVSSME